MVESSLVYFDNLFNDIFPQFVFDIILLVVVMLFFLVFVADVVI